LIVTRVESFCEKCDSSRVGSPSFSMWLESSQSHQKSWLESSWVIDSSHTITDEFYKLKFGEVCWNSQIILLHSKEVTILPSGSVYLPLEAKKNGKIVSTKLFSIDTL